MDSTYGVLVIVLSVTVLSVIVIYNSEAEGVLSFPAWKRFHIPGSAQGHPVTFFTTPAPCIFTQTFIFSIVSSGRSSYRNDVLGLVHKATFCDFELLCHFIWIQPTGFVLLIRKQSIKLFVKLTYE